MPRALRFLWWNLDHLNHYDATRAGEKNWPRSAAEHGAKRAAITQVLTAIANDSGRPDLLALCEVTRQAAIDLRDRLFPGYEVESFDLLAKSKANIALIFSRAVGFETVQQLVVPCVPRTSRPMAVLDYREPGHCIRFVACHWPPQMSPTEDEYRGDAAKHLARHAFDFLTTEEAGIERHLVVLGDLNEEPFGMLERKLHATRWRGRSLRARHWADAEVKRVHLYNCAWRLLGEQAPHAGKRNELRLDAAGTYFYDGDGTWHTFDQVIVSGSLLGEVAPYLDEASLGVHPGALLQCKNHLPQHFEWDDAEGKGLGVSDHLPVLGQLTLERSD
ncbi:MAG: hypothetical protein QM765_14835 [Myxococcales bacterium]